MIRLLVGIALAPTAGLALWSAARAIGGLATLPSAFPFLAGLAAAAAAWGLARYGLVSDTGPLAFVARMVRRAYVFGHELTHALAAWGMGASVLGFKATGSGGHVDLSKSNALIALAPYCVPIYAVLAVAGFRALSWLRPAAASYELFLLVLGATLAFHALKTGEVLWDRRQPDLAAGGGAVFSLSCIALANGLLLLLLVKALFPSSVPLGRSLADIGAGTLAFWSAARRFVAPLSRSFVAQLR